MVEPMTRTLDAPGATLTYDVRGELAGDAAGRVLMMVGSPMDASGFGTLAARFTDRPVVTYDPRGTGRSPRTGGAPESTPDEHADDLRRVIEALGVGPVDLFASSGGAVNSLALVAKHPDLVRTLVAHEPPVARFLPDRDVVLAVCADIHATYQRDGLGPAMAKFIALTSQRGPLPAGYLERPAPNPADFGLPTADDGSRDDPLVGQNIRTCSAHEHDLEALAAASTRIVIAVGAESRGELAARGAEALAERLGTTPVVFPSHHGGFLGDEFGMPGDPDAFAATLRDVLSAR
ncbi:Pimeloyl-ACP methyl ester carboxylesterase [Amycolatopsis arida]|uniref:Pimeloyl-ACP methyl ester carboxylesterase n=1 Tax=Amycolatopsis arida TaxID=587909 RepID=A0A1I5MCM8_9PSEU|nr:alpha/beta hydrolase [Amycolatopsis arida]TDX94033.1 pimeloyl-ACP methyl ester carboxylesterase [Amycolatopsis arida]SFP06716.1 Pimeloyl-ACP methyl ester carboxylesterase [Amycolatopsis arida]